MLHLRNGEPEEHLAECTLTMKVKSKGTKGIEGNDR